MIGWRSTCDRCGREDGAPPGKSEHMRGFISESECVPKGWAYVYVRGEDEARGHLCPSCVTAVLKRPPGAE